ncbi:MAG: pseudouridine synthase [Gammaproteobacteria bacterium]|nr:pseudouridine synthase [Gammaproteobacteria bacterium]NIR81649.1 pseudouridine synthase [Gammaproteobacteria bacterium]NIR88200.1 pseudouridine synthase [Gammaproteobacteria bacterium]NIU02761.1 pseudouridine synthase [Gammaproteobacteria bacterium]NIV73360.1 pseudouridine synthase [Gammaproteobacteria bacterium]
MSEDTEKLQKVLARAGLGSRRALEQWIAQGRVTVNGERAELGTRVRLSDVVCVDGRRVRLPPAHPARSRVLLYHKPVGEVCTRRDPEGRPTVFARLPRLKGGRWIPVGRLDVNTSGLLLFTDDGALAHRLMHPSTGFDREYAVRVFGEVTPEILERLRRGVMLDDGAAHFDDIVFVGGEGTNQWYHVALSEGRKREVRRLWESQGLRVSRLIRVRYGPVQLPPHLRRGDWEELPESEVQWLRSVAGLAEAPQAGSAARSGGAPARSRPGERRGERPSSGTPGVGRRSKKSRRRYR